MKKMNIIRIYSDINPLNTLQLIQVEEGPAFPLTSYRVNSEKQPLDPEGHYEISPALSRALVWAGSGKGTGSGSLVAGPPTSCQNVAELKQRSLFPHMTIIQAPTVKGVWEKYATKYSPAL